MNVTLPCVSCRALLPVRAADPRERVSCGRCGRVMAVEWTQDLREDRLVDRCPLCQGSDFYSRKDFDPRLGLSVVIAGAAVSAGFYWFGLDLVAYGVLGTAAVIDFFIYRFLPEVTICYRCHAEFRGAYARTAPAFDLHTADVLEHEWGRRVERL